MNILIIGGTGVLSTAIVNEALKNNISITVINRGNRTHRFQGDIAFIKSDKDNYSLIQTELGNRTFDAVIDFICYNEEETKRSFTFYKQYTKQYFFISSCAVYNTSLGGIFHEDSPKSLDIWSYSVKKWQSEENLVKLAEGSGTNYTIIRPCVTYGDTRIPYGISPAYGYHWTLIERILKGKPIIRWNKGENRCNMMRVEDFAIGLVGLIGNSKAYNEAFNICGDETPSFNEVLDCISENIGVKAKVIDITSEFYAQELPSRKGEILGGRSIDSINSNEKVKQIVPKFKQTITLKEGIAKTIEAYKDNDFQNGIDWEFDGDTDRIIKKWCKKNKIDDINFKLYFIDYLNKNKLKNRFTYWIAYNKDNFLGKICNLAISSLRKIIR